jgi:hypothetical protein
VVVAAAAVVVVVVVVLVAAVVVPVPEVVLPGAAVAEPASEEFAAAVLSVPLVRVFFVPSARFTVTVPDFTWIASSAVFVMDASD